MSRQGPEVKYSYTESTTIDGVAREEGQIVALLDTSGLYYDVTYNGTVQRYPVTQIQFVQSDPTTGQSGILYVNTAAQTIGIWDDNTGTLSSMSGSEWEPIET